MTASPRKLAAQRARNAAYKAAGLCRCGRAPAPNRKSCSQCLASDNVTAKRRYLRKTESILERARAARRADLEGVRASDRERHRRARLDPVRSAKLTAAARDDRYRRNFGLTVADVAAMHEAQNFCCAICERPFAETGGRGAKGLGHVDHCHVRGKVRALLCLRCNTAVGKLETWSASGLLERMHAYVERFK